MSNFTRRLAGASLIYGLGGMLSRMISLLLLPVLTRYLTPTDYGVIAMLAVMSNLLLGAVTLGTGNSLGICFQEAAAETGERGQVVWSTCAVIVVSATLWAAVGVLASPWISEVLFGTAAYRVPVCLAFGQLAVSAAVLPLLGRWRLEERARPYVAATLSLAFATAVANIYVVVVLRLGLLGMLWSTFLIQAAYCVVLYAIFWLQEQPGPPRIEARWMTRVVRIGWPSIFGVGAFFLLDFGGRLIVKHFAGLDALGVYSIGLSLGLTMALLTEGAFGAAWPAFFLSFHDKREQATQVFGRILHHYVVIFLTLATAFFLLARPVVDLLAAEPFRNAAQVVGLVALCSVLKGVYLIFVPGLYFHRKLHVQTALEWFGAVAGLAACLLLVPVFGIVGAALGTVIGYIALCVATAAVTRSYLRIDVDMARLAWLAVLFGAVAGLSFLDLGASALWNWLARGTTFVLVALLIVGLFARDVWRDVRRELQPR